MNVIVGGKQCQSSGLTTELTEKRDFTDYSVNGDGLNEYSVDTHLRGYILRATSMPGQYDRKAARAVSSNRPKMRIRFLWRVNTVRKVELTSVTSVRRDAPSCVRTSFPAAGWSSSWSYR